MLGSFLLGFLAFPQSSEELDDSSPCVPDAECDATTVALSGSHAVIAGNFGSDDFDEVAERAAAGWAQMQPKWLSAAAAKMADHWASTVFFQIDSVIFAKFDCGFLRIENFREKLDKFPRKSVRKTTNLHRKIIVKIAKIEAKITKTFDVSCRIPQLGEVQNNVIL
jgi:hypothetical protein